MKSVIKKYAQINSSMKAVEKSFGFPVCELTVQVYWSTELLKGGHDLESIVDPSKNRGRSLFLLKEIDELTI